jgi:hypothetical protein
MRIESIGSIVWSVGERTGRTIMHRAGIFACTF